MNLTSLAEIKRRRETVRSIGGREYVLAFGPADPEVKRGGIQLSVHQCVECLALVVEDFMPLHERWHRELSAEQTERSS